MAFTQINRLLLLVLLASFTKRAYLRLDYEYTGENCHLKLSRVCECVTEPKARVHSIEVACHNFDRFEEVTVNFACSLQAKFSGLVPWTIKLYPNKPLLMDDSFHDRVIHVTMVDELFLYYLRGFELTSNMSDFGTYVALSVDYSTLAFFLNGINTDDICDVSILNYNLPPTLGYLTEIKFLANVKYSTRHCPFVYHRADIYDLTVMGLAKSIVRTNLLEFTHPSGEHLLNETVVRALSVFAYNYDLNERLLNKFVFSHTTALGVAGVLNSVTTGTLKQLINLKNVYVRVANIREFFRIGTSWINDLNTREKVNLSELTSEINLVERMVLLVLAEDYQNAFDLYDYPDEDFCRFTTFPHNQLVYPYIRTRTTTGKRLRCTCTAYWLTQYYQYYEDDMGDEVEYRFNTLEHAIKNKFDLVYNWQTFGYCGYASNLSARLSKCHFAQRLNACTPSSVIKRHKKYLNNYEMRNGFRLAEFIVAVILQPLICIFAAFLNIAIVIVVDDVKREPNASTAASMYAYMQWNAVFSALYCVLSVIKPSTLCIDFIGIFCSTMRATSVIQWFNIVFISYLGSVCKICSNLTYLAFAVDRYAINAAETPFLRRVQKLRVRRVIISICALSLLLCIEKCLEYRVNRQNPDLGFPVDISMVNSAVFLTIVVDTREIPSVSINRWFLLKRTWVIVLQLSLIIVQVINDFVILFISLFVDICLWVVVRRNIKQQKKKRLDTNKSERRTKADTNLAKMIVRNGVACFTLRLPQLTFIVIHQLYVFAAQRDPYDHKTSSFTLHFNFFWHYSKDAIGELTESLYVVTFILPFIFYYSYNASFKRTFRRKWAGATCIISYVYFSIKVNH